MTKYNTLEDFLLDNPGWIDKNERLPEEETKVSGLVWMWGNFIIMDVWFVNKYNGWRHYIENGAYWSEKVSHWRPLVCDEL